MCLNISWVEDSVSSNKSYEVDIAGTKVLTTEKILNTCIRASANRTVRITTMSSCGRVSGDEVECRNSHEVCAEPIGMHYAWRYDVEWDC